MFQTCNMKHTEQLVCFLIDTDLHTNKIEISIYFLGDIYMIVTVYIVYILIAVINTWYLITQLKFKKELAASAASPELLKETRISIGFCMLIYLVDILLASITTTIA